MLILLTPSKTMDFTTEMPISIPDQQPLFLEKTKKIAKAIKLLSKEELANVMKASPVIVANVKNMYGTWQSEGKKPALWSYKGDVYKGIYADQLSKERALWAEEHLVMMSGLYGVLRPFDKISPYRLEMKAPLKIDGKKDLYDFWGTKLANYVESRANGLVYDLCSDEYAKGVIRHLSPNTRIINPVFYDERPNGMGRAPIYNKMMRGVMARWMIDHRAEKPEDLKKFTMHGYAYDAKRSTADEPAFYRKEMKPLVF